ncbi:MAG: hypothetical protein LBT50_04615 [Prevotellaceae bacterium]|jgi:hypothetical protein|nr:hypothetical protein [Prevotellaceae bacterium]
MNKRIFLFLAISVCLSSIFSCSKDESPVSESGKLGQVTSDRTRYGVGQLINLSCTVADGQNLINTQHTFVPPSGVGIPVSVQNGVITAAFTPDAAGSTTVKFRQQSIGVDGQEYSVESPLTFTVVECDFLNSFWGDNVAECIRNSPTLIAIPGLDNNYSVETNSFSYGYGGSTNTVTASSSMHYFFASDQLYRGFISVAPVTGLSKFYHLYVGLDLSRRYTEDVHYSCFISNDYTPSAELVAILTKIETGDLADFNDTEKLGLINEAMSAGKIYLKYEGQIRNTKVSLIVSNSGNSANFTIVE